MSLEALKTWIRARPALETLAYVVHNNCAPFLNFSGTSLLHRSPADGAKYVRAVADRYMEAAVRVGRDFKNAVVLEVGPGDNLGVALTLIAWGARQVVCVDRFNCLGEAHSSRAMYRHLIQGFSPEERRRVESACPWCVNPDISINRGAIRFLPDLPIERARERLKHQKFDCVLSNAALEHVGSVDAAVHATASLLKRSGWMFHEVDLRSHGRYEAVSPLYFLTISHKLWRIMTSRVGAPNRSRIGVYRKAFADAGLALREEVVEATPVDVASSALPHVDPALDAPTVEELRALIVRFLALRTPRGRGAG